VSNPHWSGRSDDLRRLVAPIPLRRRDCASTFESGECAKLSRHLPGGGVKSDCCPVLMIPGGDHPLGDADGGLTTLRCDVANDDLRAKLSASWVALSGRLETSTALIAF